VALNLKADIKNHLFLCKICKIRGLKMNPWHDVEIGKNSPDIINVLIEIPKFSKTKFEIDKKTGLLIVDRVLYSSVHYPANYGFIPRTYCDDKDPLDVLVLGQAEVYPLSIMRVRPIGVLRMIDQGEGDDKIIAVHEDDPEMSAIHSIDDLSPHTLKEIRNFFETYKILEKKSTSIEGVGGREEALKIIAESIKLYEDQKENLRNS